MPRADNVPHFQRGSPYGPQKAGISPLSLEDFMRLIRAQASDWHPDRPDIRPGKWTLPVICAVLILFALIAFAGHLANGSGSPFLGGL